MADQIQAKDKDVIIWGASAIAREADCPTALPPTTCLSAACYRHAESAGSGSRPEVSYGALSPAPAAIEQGVSDVRKFIALGQPEGSVRAIKVESVYVNAFGLLHVNHCTTSSSRRV